MRQEFLRMAGGLTLAVALVSAAPCLAFATGGTEDVQSGGGTSEIAVATPSDDDAVPQDEGDVAQIGDKTYAALDEAIADASDGDIPVSINTASEAVKNFENQLRVFIFFSSFFTWGMSIHMHSVR